MKKIWIILATALGVVAFTGVTANAAAYPPPPPDTTTTVPETTTTAPEEPTTTTTEAIPLPPPGPTTTAATTTTVAISVQPPPGRGPLPRTGAGFDQPLLVGLTALIVGGGLILIARQRRSSENA